MMWHRQWTMRPASSSQPQRQRLRSCGRVLQMRSVQLQKQMRCAHISWRLMSYLTSVLQLSFAGAAAQAGWTAADFAALSG